MTVRQLACFVSALILLPISRGQNHGHKHHTLPNVDRRQSATHAPLPPSASPTAAAATGREQSATKLRGNVKNVRIDRDPLLGTPAFVASVSSHLTGPNGLGGGVSDAALNRHSPGDSHRAVKAFIDEYQPLFGHGSEVLANAKVARDYVTGHNGARTIVWQQQLDGIRVFESVFQAHLTNRGELVNVASRFLADVESAVERGASGRAARVATPAITAAAAVAIAAGDIGEEVNEEDVTAEGAAEGPEKKQKFRAPVLLDAEVQFVWLPLNGETARLCWEVICTGKTRSHMYRVLVDADSGEVHVRQGLTEEASNATYRVFTSDSPSPFSPGHATPSSVQPPIVPRALVTLSALSLIASPNGWIDDGVMETRGNNVDAHTDTDANNVADLPRPQAVGPDRVFDFPLDLTQAPSTYRDAAVVDLFFWCNWMHDKLYELGFTEAAGNFQINNFGRGGLGNDPLQADAQDGSGTNNANFSTPPDGTSPRMQMFLWTGPNPDRDGDFEHEVVLHEYAHGLTNRMVGGGVGMSASQSRGMGEGWSDFYGIALLAEPGDDLNGNWARGGYSRYLASGTFTENYYFGGRRYPYSTNMSKNPLTFKDIDPTQASAHAGIPRSPIVGITAEEVHNQGEVWCVTLWDLRANLINKHGFATGSHLALQLITDALRFTPANPNFIQARDAILQSDLVNTGGANRLELWAAFAKRGLGSNASAPASTTTVGVVESFTFPDDLSVTPFGLVAVSGNINGPFPPQTYTLSNTGGNPLSWTATNTQPWLTVSPASGTLAGGATTLVTATFNASANALPGGNYSDTITFTNTGIAVSQARAITLTIQAPPTISSFAPAVIAAGLPVTVTGTAFTAPLTVLFNGVASTNVTINSTTQITATAPTSLTAGPITVITGGGSATSATNYTITNLPIITSFTPLSGPVKRQIRVNGANFSGGLVSSRTVRVGNVSIGSSSVNANWITFAVPSGAVTAPITITTNSTTGPIGTATSATNFVVAAGPAPANDHFANAQAISGSAGTVDVNNTNATREAGEPRHAGNVGGASVWFSWVAPSSGPFEFQVRNTEFFFGSLIGVYVGNSVDALALVANGTSNSVFFRNSTAASFVATAGTTYRIAVDGYEGLMGDVELEWSTLGAPTISSIPATAYAGQAVQINGSNLVPAATVTVAGNVSLSGAALTANSSSFSALSITQLPVNALSGPITVSTVAGTVVSSTNLTVTTPPVPSVTSISPTSGAAGATVTINGTALSLAEPGFPIVRFNGTPVTTLTSQTSTSLSVRVPVGATTGTVSVQTSRGTGVSSSNFTVTTSSTPVFFGFTPASGPVGSNIVLSGVNLTTTSGVQINGMAAPFVVNSSGQVTVTVPPGATSGTVRLSTSSPAVNINSATAFVVTSPPTINGFSPGALAAGMPVVITGTNFSAVTGVSFNGLPGTFVVNSNSQITATVPAGPLVPGPITVTTQEGSATSAASFTLFSGPFISSFTPSALASGVSVVITGSGFTGTSSVRFNGTTGNFTVNSPTQITATAPTTVTPGAITVTANGLPATSANYTVTTAPIITSFSPTTANRLQEITVFGGNFLTNITSFSVTVNGTSVSATSRNNNRVVFPIPATATSGPIVITTNVGSTTSAGNVTVASGPAPANDTFANAQLISGLSGSFSGNSANATKEPGEPNHQGNAGGASVWFRWVAPTSGWYLFNPFDTAGTHFGMIMGIYTGNSVNALTQVASGIPGTSSFPRYSSSATFNAVAGQAYYIAVDGFNGYQFDYRLSWLALGVPTISSFSPSSAAAGQTITIGISGSGFAFGSDVMIGGAPVAANRITYNSPTSISVSQIPAEAITGPIKVTNVLGTGTSAANFNITSPYILAFSPSGGAVGTAVTITGANFTGATAVRFNGVPSLFFGVAGGGQAINATVPPGASSGPISVVTPLGTGTSPTSFVVITPPVITQHPISQMVSVDSPVTFTVAADSNGPLEYQWWKDGWPILGNPTAQSATLQISAATTGDAGVYFCNVGNAAAIVPSLPATLVVNKLSASIALTQLAAVYDGLPKPVGFVTTPAGLDAVVTYNGLPIPPTNAGSYPVIATITDARYAGTVGGTLVIDKAIAPISFANLAQTYDGTPKPVTVGTTPGGLGLSVTYDGATAAPTNAGSYAVAALISDANYRGSANATLTIAKAAASPVISKQLQMYDGTPRPVTVTTTPAGRNVEVSYNGSSTPPTYPGIYPLVASVVEANYAGSTPGTLVIIPTALVRHAPILSGGIDGSLQVTTAESVALNGPAWVARDLLLPGSPLVQLNGSPTFVGTRDAAGSADPTGHAVSLNGSAALRYLVRRVNPLPLAPVAPPAAPMGTRTVVINSTGGSLGDPATILDLTARGAAGRVAVPPGTYRRLTAEGAAGFVLGVAGSIQPATYQLQELALNGTGALEIAGPVILTLANSLTLDGPAGSSAQPGWLTLLIANGGLTLNSRGALYGVVVVPNGAVTINGNSTLTGRVTADRLIIQGNGVLTEVAP